MAKSTIIWLLVLGVVLVAVSVLLRVRSNGKYELKTGDMVFLLIPLLLVALATGKLKGLDIFGVKADLSTLFSKAAEANIDNQVAAAAPATVQDVVQVVDMAAKGGMRELQDLIVRRVEALNFKLGSGNYYAPAIKSYFEALSGSSQLRFVVLNKQDGTLFGLYQAPDLIGYLRVTGERGYADFQSLLNSGDAEARAKLARLPGFVSGDAAVTVTTSKRDALTSMEKLNVDSLPVVDPSGRFAGTVERGKLTTSLILEVTRKIASVE